MSVCSCDRVFGCLSVACLRGCWARCVFCVLCVSVLVCLSVSVVVNFRSCQFVRVHVGVMYVYELISMGV